MNPLPELHAAIARIVSLGTADDPRGALGEAARAEALLGGTAADPAAAARLAAFRALPHFIAADFDAAALAAEASLLASTGAEDPEARALALASRLLAGAGALWAAADRAAEEGVAEELWALRGAVLGRPGDAGRRLPGILLTIDALFTSGRVGLAVQALDEAFPGHDWAVDPLPGEADGHRFPSAPFLPLRVLFYTGRISEAARLHERVVAEARDRGDAFWLALSPAIDALVSAASGRAAEVRRARTSVARAFPHPRGYLQGSARALVGAGLAAIGDAEGAAEEILAGGGPGLRRLILIDRSLSIEVLVGAALSRGDRAAAERWARRLIPLTAQAASEGVGERVFALLDLERGEVEPALRHADAALARASLSGALRDAARNELVLARALAASGRTVEAAGRLQRVAAEAERRGDRADRRDAARQLRLLGRRVQPPPGSEWAGLTEREREIALLAARGYDNRAIGAALFLSPRTVQGSLTRIMSAFGVTRRAALPARIAAGADGAPLGPSMRPAPLTARQAEVANRVAAGLTNAQIAQELGISVKTVERHLADIFAVWEVRSRAAVAYLAAQPVAT